MSDHDHDHDDGDIHACDCGATFDTLDELKEEREYCLTCETFVDADARKPE